MPQCDICGKVIAVPNRAICSGMKMNVCDECLKYCEKKVEYKSKTPKPSVKVKRVEPPKPRPAVKRIQPPKPRVEIKRFVKSKNSNVYHGFDCERAKQIKKENITFLKNVNEAAYRSFRPCKVCKPNQ